MAPVALVRWAVLVALSVAVAVGDLTRRIVPNALSAVGIVAGLALASVSGWPSFRAGLLGAAVFGGPMLVLWFIGAAGGGEGLVGAGDAKAALAFGTLLGMPSALDGLWCGVVAGAVLAIGAIAAGLWQSRNALVAALRGAGVGGLVAAVAADPVWAKGIPYGAALAAGSLLAGTLSRI